MSIPKDSAAHMGEFIVYFSDESDPEILFSSFFGEEAYEKAAEIKKETKRELTVFRVTEPVQTSASMMFKR